MDVEREVARHYTHGSLENAILSALTAAGKDISSLAPADLSGADEFHFGWRAATEALARDLGLSPGMHVLDVGSGIGGPARYFAEAHGVRVTGIDLTEEFVSVANRLTERCGLADRVSFHQAIALDLPFPDRTFDAATMIHVGMNIERKEELFRQIGRVVKSGSLFGVYDIMRRSDAALSYPQPWASSPETSFVERPVTYRSMLEDAGFAVDSEIDRRDLTLKLAREMRENATRQGAPPVGLHVLMGPASRERLANAMAALTEGIIAPVQMIARRL